MSEVIRRAIIELELRQKKGGLSGDSFGGKKVYEEQTKAAKEVEKQTIRNDRVMQDFGRTTKEFGDRSHHSYMRGVSGVMELTRGIGLLAANGGEDTKKLLEHIIALQGGIDLVRGSMHLFRLGPEFGAIGAAVTAGAASWMLYSQQADKAKKIIADLTAEFNKASQAESRLTASHIANQDATRAAMTDAERNTPERRAAQNRELEQIRRERADQNQTMRSESDSAFRNRRAAERNRSEASTLPNGLVDAFLRGGSGADAQVQRDRLTKAAEQQEKAAKEHTAAAEAATQQALTNAEREKQIIESQTDERIAAIRQREAQQIEGIRRSDEALTPQEKWQRDKDKFMFDRQKSQQQPFVDAFGPPGMSSVFRAASMQDLREGGIHSQANSEIGQVQQQGTAAVKEVVSVLNMLHEEIIKFKAEVTSGQTD